MPRVRKTAGHQTARVSLPVHAGSSQGGRDYDSDRFTTTTLRKRDLASCFSVMESTIEAFPSTEKPDSRLCHVRSSKNSDGPTKEAVGAIRQHGSSGWSAGPGNHLARHVKPQHLKIAAVSVPTLQ